MIIKKSGPLKGSVTVPGDKSISHRAIMLGSLAQGKTEVDHFLLGDDCLSTITCFRKLSIPIELDANNRRVTIHGKGLDGLLPPKDILDVGNSGTTIRLLSGILSGQKFKSTITGDASIRQRPMGRILTPLRQMGADIESVNSNGCAPLKINTSNNIKTEDKNLRRKANGLKATHYNSPVASAQVKSSILLAGLYADGETKVTEPFVSRNHTELMLSEFGGQVTVSDNTVSIQPRPRLTSRKVTIPGDISSAAYFIVAALIVANSELLIKNVGINPTRDGILHVCHMMGADIRLENIKNDGGERSADILVKHSNLKGIEISGSIIPSLIDEIPIIAVLSCFAEGKTVIKDAEELKVKESNRIEVMVNNLTNMGADITATEDGMIINGGRPLHGADIDSKLDHRIAMSFAVAGLAADGETNILDPECVAVSYPDFFEDLLGKSKL
ncbi:MAG: 3-phosphoshikimate 1-carboxyvinyltransferase [Clostridiales bacterium]|nr:3-phosphoshikimate 1-carboxyvinyltransferase [Bacillota bacterium]NLK03743.1 3-phosphoshikimate 1-carboxyvinyltransferase [Clostridiales bacterium]